ncbi:MAG: hypothetical protein Q4P06_00530 [Actinomycetaceae bacterium]|nr:hypothetical protein [Actinomycetaceae bacterium]
MQTKSNIRYQHLSMPHPVEADITIGHRKHSTAALPQLTTR